MLKEITGIPQNASDGNRRWFVDDQMELIVWCDLAGRVNGFQLSYDRGRDERLIQWSGKGPLRHGRVDSGEGSPVRNDSPVLKAGGAFDAAAVADEFVGRAKALDRGIAGFVERKIRDHAAPAQRRPGEVAPTAAPGGGATRKTTVPAAGRSAARGPAPARKSLTSFKADPLNKAQNLPDEIMRKVKRVELFSRKMVSDVMSGQYRSQFKGHGVQFSEHRVYNAGDDIRHIDWKVSARSRDLLVKKYEEERELTVFLVVDISGSKEFGSKNHLKSEVAAEIGGMLAYAAVQTGDKVGALLFAGEVEKIVPPKKGRQHVLRIVRELLGAQGETGGTDLAAALDAAGRIMKHAGIVFVLSDFQAEGYEIALKRLARRHDVIALWLGDPREKSMPQEGMVMLHDPETGENRMVDLGSYAFKKWLSDQVMEHETDAVTALNSSGVDRLRISTEEDYGEAVVRFFMARGRRRR
ncbi:MAG TPA: DUF58 domain-containing protein [Bdellovibrionota bacterium]|nr:DUF58 domain-containing protein [Bdellovibrionota bacterium]